MAFLFPVLLLEFTLINFEQGNEFLEAILDGPVVMIKDPRTEKNRVIDPGHIGRQLMGFRQLEAQLVVEVRPFVTLNTAAGFGGSAP